MADNYTVTQGTGTTMASDDVGGVHYPIVKLAEGAANAATLVSDSNPLPVEPVGKVAHDATMSGNPIVTAGVASAAAPTSVSADGDVVQAWRLRNGAEAVVITAAGALVGGDATNGLDVDVTRMSALVAGSAKIGAVDLDSDATPGSAVPATAQLVAGTDGTNARSLKTDTSGELQVDVLTQPASVRTSDTVSTALATDAIMSNTTALTPKFAAIAAASSGDNTLLAAVASKKIRVLALMGVAAGAVSLYFTSGAGGTVIFGGSTNKIALAANGGFVLPFNPLGWFENSSTNQALVLNLSSAVAFSGGFVYVEV